MASPLPAPLAWAWAACALAFTLVQAPLLLFALHRLLTLRRHARARRAPAPAPAQPAAWPAVTVQLPLYNERTVAARLIDAVAAFDYPADRLQVQVLDDSTDETLAVARERVAHWARRGVAITLLHRERRDGFKAGALRDGLRSATGEIVAVFDADFLPAPDFLLRTVPHFADPRIGMVQARWGHLNREGSALTRAQAVLLDAHFLLEHRAREAAGLFFNFNGTAGAWRRSCIDGAGGWSHDTLTEDLDLSYRAQLAGWRFAFAPDVVADAELPADVLALKSQQRRWVKGSVQTARKLLPALLRSALPARVKLEAVVHLTANAAYPLLLLSGLLLGSVLALPPMLPARLAAAADAAAIACGFVPLVLFLYAGQRAAGRNRVRSFADLFAALVLGAGLSLNNAVAVLEGLGPAVGAWERTPKAGDGPAGSPRAYAARRDRTALAELALALAFGSLALFASHAGRARATPFLVVLACGLAWVGVRSLAAGARAPRPCRMPPGPAADVPAPRGA